MLDTKIALVGYLNTKPFEYGLKTSANRASFNIYYDTPARCARLYQEDIVDIALVPVGALPEMGEYRIVTDTCIGCTSYVRTVVLMGKQPMDQWRKVHLDSHSRSSALLSRIILKEKVSHDIQFTTASINELSSIADTSGVLMIGDKVFEREEDFPYRYDLGREWYLSTGLPFAYAVWIAKPRVQDEQIASLNTALRLGLDNMDKVIAEEESKQPKFSLASYYKENIDYDLDDAKRKAIALYLEKASQL